MDYKKATELFSKQMLKVMQDNGYKDPIPVEHLFKNLQGEVLELQAELLKGRKSKKAIRKESVDVANYAMMIYLASKGIELPAEREPQLTDTWPNYRYG